MIVTDSKKKKRKDRIFVLTMFMLFLLANLGYKAYVLFYMPAHYKSRPFIQITSPEEENTYHGFYEYPLKNMDEEGEYVLERTIMGIDVYKITDSDLLRMAKDYVVVFHRSYDIYNPWNTVTLYRDGQVVEYIELNRPGIGIYVPSWWERSTTCIWPLWVISHWELVLISASLAVLWFVLIQRFSITKK